MIYEFKVNPNMLSKTDSFHYMNDLSSFPKKIKFKSGINVICGSNGSGKTTLLNILKTVMLCQKSFYSEYPREFDGLYFSNLAKDLHAFKVKADYRYVTFNYREVTVFDKEGYGWMDTYMNMIQTMQSKRISSGQNKLLAFNMLFDKMFGKGKLRGDELLFPLKRITEYEKSNEHNKAFLTDYYTLNQKDNPIEVFTLLMDEPDNNLDIFNIKDTNKLYSVKREDTQIIVSLHNPIVLYRLSIQKNPPNFIELTPGYIQAVNDFVNK